MGRSKSQIHRISRQTLKVPIRAWDLPWETGSWASGNQRSRNWSMEEGSATQVDPGLKSLPARQGPWKTLGQCIPQKCPCFWGTGCHHWKGIPASSCTQCRPLRSGQQRQSLLSSVPTGWRPASRKAQHIATLAATCLQSHRSPQSCLQIRDKVWSEPPASGSM